MRNIVMLCSNPNAKNIKSDPLTLRYNVESYALAIVVVAMQTPAKYICCECVMDKIYLNDENGVAIRVKATARTEKMSISL